MADFLRTDTDGKHLRFGTQGGIILRGMNFNNANALDLNSGQQPPYQGHDITKQLCDESDYALIQSWGGNHVRWGFSMQSLTEPAFFQVFDQHVEFCRRRSLFMIPICHVPPGGSDGGFGGQQEFWNSVANQVLWVNGWKTIAQHYANEPVIGAWDVINEPQDPNNNMVRYNAAAQAVYDGIRAVDPNHLVCFEASGNPNALPNLTSTPGTVLWSQHFYGALVGHDGANFTGPDTSHPERFPMWIGETGETGRTQTEPTATNLGTLDGLVVGYCLFVQREGGSGGYGIVSTDYTPGSQANPNQNMINVAKARFPGCVQPNFGPQQPHVYTVRTATGVAVPPTETVQQTACDRAHAEVPPGYVTDETGLNVCDFRPPPAGQVIVSQAVQVTPNPVQAGQSATATAKLKNTGTAPITITDVVLAGRPPGSSKATGPVYADFIPNTASLTLAPGQESPLLTATRSFTAADPTGPWKVFVTWAEGGVYKNNQPTDPDVTLQVGVAGDCAAQLAAAQAALAACQAGSAAKDATIAQLNAKIATARTDAQKVVTDLA